MNLVIKYVHIGSNSVTVEENKISRADWVEIFKQVETRDSLIFLGGMGTTAMLRKRPEDATNVKTQIFFNSEILSLGTPDLLIQTGLCAVCPGL